MTKKSSKSTVDKPLTVWEVWIVQVGEGSLRPFIFNSREMAKAFIKVDSRENPQDYLEGNKIRKVCIIPLKELQSIESVHKRRPKKHE